MTSRESKTLQSAKCKLRIEKCTPAMHIGLGARLARSFRQFAFGDLRFAICNRDSRQRRRLSRAITLTEVLISMGILTLGLLGVAAMFPVGSYYMQKGDVSDRASAIAQSVLNDAVTQGMLDPKNWYVLVPNVTGATVDSPGFKFSVDPTNALLRYTYTRPFAAALGESIARSTGLVNPQTIISKQLGNAFVLDPMGVASFAFLQPSFANRYGYSFPATANSVSVPASYYAGYSNSWTPWANSGNAEDTWPIRRVTFQQPFLSPQISQEPMKVARAEALFSSHDDLSMDLPGSGDAPSTQNWAASNIGGTMNPLSRQARGDYSWIITVVPKTVEARNALATSGDGQAYDVSAVVFYKRVLNRTDPGATDPTEAQAESIVASDFLKRQERSVQASILSTGPSGGEVLLSAYSGPSPRANDGVVGSPFENLKAGEWMMICGPHPDSTLANPRFVMNWYRILAIEGKDTKLDASGAPSTNPGNEPERQIVSLRGPQWPWQPNNTLSNWLCGGIFPGAVAVHNKTIRLENSTSYSVD